LFEISLATLDSRADVAQLVERNLAKVEVAGSNPVVRSSDLIRKVPPGFPRRDLSRLAPRRMQSSRRGHVSHEGSYLSFDGTAGVSPIATETHGPTMDILVGAYRAAAKKEHPDWGDFREAMVRERRRVITVNPTGVVGLIRPVWA
jgi:hypothetical protein